MTLSSGGALAIDTVGTDAANLGIEAAAETITMVMMLLAKVDVNALATELDSAGSVVTDSASSTSTTSGTTATLSSGGVLAIDTVGTAATNLGTENKAETITIGNDASTKVDVNALAYELDSAGSVVTDSVTSTTITSGTSKKTTSGTTATLSSGGALAIDTVGTDAEILGIEAAVETICRQ